jgi:hypothetical protein
MAGKACVKELLPSPGTDRRLVAGEGPGVRAGCGEHQIYSWTAGKAATCRMSPGKHRRNVLMPCPLIFRLFRERGNFQGYWVLIAPGTLPVEAPRN